MQLNIDPSSSRPVYVQVIDQIKRDIALSRQLGTDAGIEWIGLSTHGTSYARTLEAWDRRFVEAWPKIASQSDRFDERFYRMWRYYLAYCIAGFRTGRIDGVQAIYRKPGVGDPPAAISATDR